MSAVERLILRLPTQTITMQPKIVAKKIVERILYIWTTGDDYGFPQFIIEWLSFVVMHSISFVHFFFPDFRFLQFAIFM